VLTHHDIDDERQTIVSVVATSFDYQLLADADTPLTIIEHYLQQRESLHGSSRCEGAAASSWSEVEGSPRRGITTGAPCRRAGPRIGQQSGAGTVFLRVAETSLGCDGDWRGGNGRGVIRDVRRRHSQDVLQRG
jgi:hypothetical protein